MRMFLVLMGLSLSSLPLQARPGTYYVCSAAVQKADGTLVNKYTTSGPNYVRVVFKFMARCEAENSEAFCSEQRRCRKLPIGNGHDEDNYPY